MAICAKLSFKIWLVLSRNEFAVCAQKAVKKIQKYLYIIKTFDFVLFGVYFKGYFGTFSGKIAHKFITSTRLEGKNFATKSCKIRNR